MSGTILDPKSIAPRGPMLRSGAKRDSPLRRDQNRLDSTQTDNLSDYEDGELKSTSPTRSKSENRSLRDVVNQEKLEEDELDSSDSEESYQTPIRPTFEDSSVSRRFTQPPGGSPSPPVRQSARKPQRIPPAKDCHKSSVMCIAISLIAFLVVLLLALAVHFWPQEPKTKLFQHGSVTAFTSFKQNLAAIARNFPPQSKRFWTIISSSVATILGELRDPPKQPAVLIFLHRNNPQSESRVKQLTLDIGNAVNRAIQSGDHQYDTKQLTAESYRQEPFNEAKKQLDEDLNRLLFTHQTHSVTLLDLQKLPADVVTIFYKYCDNGLAPYQNVAFMFTLAVDIPTDEEDLEIANDFSRWDSLAESQLRELWKSELNQDKREALLTRIANSVVYVSLSL